MLNRRDVFVAVPTFDAKEYCLHEFLQAVKQLPYDVLIVDNSADPGFYKRMCRAVGDDKKNIKIETIGHCFWVGDCSRKKLAVTRNYLRERFLEGQYRFFLSLESDVIMLKSEICRLIDQHSDGVSGALMEREGADTVVSRRIDYRAGKHCRRYNYPFAELVGKITEAKGIHLGCTLIPRAVLEEISFRYEPPVSMHDDSFFSADCTRAGIKIYCDGHVKPAHLWKPWPRSLVR